MNILPSATTFRPPLKLAVIRQLRCIVVSVLTLIPPQLPPLPPPSFTSISITVFLFTRLQQIQNFLVRATVKAPKSCHIAPILRCLYWLKISESIEYKLLSPTYKVLTTAQPPYVHYTSSLFNLLAALALHLWLPSLDHQHHPPYA